MLQMRLLRAEHRLPRLGTFNSFRVGDRLGADCPIGELRIRTRFDCPDVPAPMAPPLQKEAAHEELSTPCRCAAPPGARLSLRRRGMSSPGPPPQQQGPLPPAEGFRARGLQPGLKSPPPSSPHSRRGEQLGGVRDRPPHSSRSVALHPLALRGLDTCSTDGRSTLARRGRCPDAMLPQHASPRGRRAGDRPHLLTAKVRDIEAIARVRSQQRRSQPRRRSRGQASSTFGAISRHRRRAKSANRSIYDALEHHGSRRSASPTCPHGLRCSARDHRRCSPNTNS